jgi:hypothetical protein
MSMRDYLQGTSSKRRQPGASSSTAVFLGAVLLFLVGLGVFLNVKGRGNVSVDEATLCPTNRAPSEVVAVLVDVSDEMTEAQVMAVGNSLDRVLSDIRPFGLIEAYRVGSIDRTVAEPLTHICNPGTGADLNPVYQNPRLAEERWRAFRQRLRADLDTLLRGSPSTTSAVFEAVQAVGLRTFGSPQYDGMPKRLVIVSDLLQNVQAFSQYSDRRPFAEFRTTEYFSRVRVDLTGVDVLVLYLVRPSAPQSWPEHIHFWEQYLLAQGARIDRVEPIYGAK